MEADKTLHIAQNGTVVAEGDYGFRLTTAPGNGLYVNYGLKALNIHGGQKLTLAEHGGAYGATGRMSAKIGGEGDLAINTVRQVSLSNGRERLSGGNLRSDGDITYRCGWCTWQHPGTEHQQRGHHKYNGWTRR